MAAIVQFAIHCPEETQQLVKWFPVRHWDTEGTNFYHYSLDILPLISYGSSSTTMWQSRAKRELLREKKEQRVEMLSLSPNQDFRKPLAVLVKLKPVQIRNSNVYKSESKRYFFVWKLKHLTTLRRRAATTETICQMKTKLQQFLGKKKDSFLGFDRTSFKIDFLLQTYCTKYWKRFQL